MRKEYTFGYDLENIQMVVQYVTSQYEHDSFEFGYGIGDDEPNYLSIDIGDGDEELADLLEQCDGEGSFEEP